jgi:DNA-binding transcriptional LysR family regulator
MDQLHQMATFVQVVERGGFSAAARELGVAPSVVTTQIQALEKRLGARLLNRNTRHVNPTEAGEAYYRRCTDLLRRVEEADEIVGSMQTTPTGVLRLNASVLVPNLITPVISEYAARYPGVSVRLTVTGRMVDLIDENYDIAVRHKAPPNPGLIVRKVADYRFMVCGSPKYFEQRAKPLKPADLVDHNCLIYTDSEQGERWPIFNTHDDLLVAGSLHSNNTMSLVEAAENGLGLTVAPHFVVADSLRSGRLIAVLTEYTTLTFPITAIYPHRESMPLKVRLFVEMLVKHLRALPAFNNVSPSAKSGPRSEPILLSA